MFVQKEHVPNDLHGPHISTGPHSSRRPLTFYSTQNNVVGDSEVDNAVQLRVLPQSLEELVEEDGLRGLARESIEDPVLCTCLHESLLVRSGPERRMVVDLRVGMEDTHLVLEIQQVRLDNLQHNLIRQQRCTRPSASVPPASRATALTASLHNSLRLPPELRPLDDLLPQQISHSNRLDVPFCTTSKQA
jgi:hypothetical protein